MSFLEDTCLVNYFLQSAFCDHCWKIGNLSITSPYFLCLNSLVSWTIGVSKCLLNGTFLVLENLYGWTTQPTLLLKLRKQITSSAHMNA